ncbi:MAG: hypothetical protein ACJ795_13690, partial [Ktedonobacteraceae bacterium]
DLANPEPLSNLEPMFSCELVQEKLEMCFSLLLELTTTVCKRLLVERVFRPSMAVLLMIGADFLHFALILAHH